MLEPEKIVDVAKPLAEISKPIVDVASRLLAKLVGGPCGILGEIVSDHLRYWQFTRRLQLIQKVDETLRKDNIAAHAIPSGFLIPLIDAAGNVGSDELQSLWSNLVVSAVEDDSAAKTAYIEALKGMSPSEARLMRLVASEKVAIKFAVAISREFARFANFSGVGLDGLGFSGPSDFWASVGRLQGIGCLVIETIGQKIVHEAVEEPLGNSSIMFQKQVATEYLLRIKLSTFGAELVSKSTREEVNSDCIRDSWMIINDVREAAFDAGRQAQNTPSLDQVYDIVDKGMRVR